METAALALLAVLLAALVLLARRANMRLAVLTRYHRRRIADLERGVARLTAERDMAVSQQRALADTVTMLQAQVAALSPPEMSPDQRQALLDAMPQRDIQLCQHCGGFHSRACPRVKSMRFRPDGATALAIEYWPDGGYSTDNIVWPDDLAANMEPQSPQRPELKMVVTGT